jgi:SAM-dependent methyltransferase
MKPTLQDHAFENLSDKLSFDLEDTLWWIQGRKKIISNYLKKASHISRISKIMDIGCGSGGNLDVLAAYGNIIGIERSPTLARRARDKNIAEKIYEKDLFDLRDAMQIDLFTLFDVLEHIQDDHAFLVKLKSISSDKHLILISVPACQFLYSSHDELLHHYRRYSKKSLSSLLSANGYEIININYFMCFLFPLAILSRFKEKTTRWSGGEKINIGKVPAWLNRLLRMIIEAEARVSDYFKFPIGLWIFALARLKPDHSLKWDDSNFEMTSNKFSTK